MDRKARPQSRPRAGACPTRQRALPVAYLTHPVLGPRLRKCCELVLGAQGRSIGEILSYPDDLKFRSCLTLFQLAAPEEALFTQCLDKYYGGVPDPRTLQPCAG